MTPIAAATRSRGLLVAASVAALATVAATVTLATADGGPARASAAFAARGSVGLLSPGGDADAYARAASGAPLAEPLVEASAVPAAAAPSPDIAALSAQAVTAARNDDADAPRDRPRPGSERAHYEHFLALAAEPGGGLADVAHATFLGDDGADHTDAERVALLRALWDAEAPEAGRWFAHALRQAPAEPGRVTGLVTLPECAFGLLEQRAAREPAALALLADGAGAADVQPALRQRAAITVARCGTLEQLQQLVGIGEAQADPGTRAALAFALRDNEHAAGAGWSFPAGWLPQAEPAAESSSDD